MPPSPPTHNTGCASVPKAFRTDSAGYTPPPVPPAPPNTIAVVADIELLQGGTNQVALLATLSLLTGAVMILAGLLRLGRILRFVSNAVMVGFMSAVGVNIVLGQLPNLTGFAASGANRITRTVSTSLRNIEAVVRDVAIRYAQSLEKLDDDYLRERAVDVRDIGRRVLRNLTGRSGSTLAQLTEPCVVVAHDRRA